jgi:hypothetical protein
MALSYTLTNHGTRDVYVFNQLHRGIGEGQKYLTDRNLVYVEYNDARVELSKKALMPPDDFDVESPTVPVTTRVPPGASCGETLELRLPLEPYSEYPQRNDAPVSRGAPMAFELGYVALDSTTAGDFVREVGTSDGTGYMFAIAIPTGHRVLRVTGLSLPAVGP